ncbi:MFS transporter [Streptomyces sp. NBC_01619]|uniref:MFS transporter n=1 Tax=unclassified Streptomyces TaxID=2593676 RepID=UPI0022507573|nr:MULTISPECIES: MFS transporter [unclassified Streptomyces]MCX4509143.1 MFS transporter [Streptomyces sp. NBC_01619]
MSSRLRAAWPLVAVFTVGHLAAYLLPTVVGRLSTGLGLTPAQAGLLGSALLLSSATAGFGQAFLSMPVRLPFRVGPTARAGHGTPAPRGERHGPRRLARLGLLLAAAGYGAAAATSAVPVVVAGTVVGGFGSGTAAAVAAVGIAAQRDPHRVSALGLLTVSASAGALYLTIPRLGGGHALPFAALAAAALVMWPATRRLDGAGTRAGLPGVPEARLPIAPLPRRRSGAVLAVTMLCWSMAQNALWGVSGRIGVTQAGLSEVTVGAVFAVALGAGLTGVVAAGALGTRLGRAMPIGVGTALIACCIVISSSARDLTSFATGEILWNAFYPVVLSYLLGLAASLDRHGRWAVLAGSASSLGVACGPLAGSLLSEYTGYPGMGLVLCVGLLLVAVPMTAVAVHTSGRRLRPVPVPLPVPDAAPSRTAKVLAS